MIRREATETEGLVLINESLCYDRMACVYTAAQASSLSQTEGQRENASTHQELQESLQLEDGCREERSLETDQETERHNIIKLPMEFIKSGNRVHSLEEKIHPIMQAGVQTNNDHSTPSVLLYFTNFLEGETTNIIICVWRNDWLQVLYDYIITPIGVCSRSNTYFIPPYMAHHLPVYSVRNKQTQTQTCVSKPLPIEYEKLLQVEESESNYPPTSENNHQEPIHRISSNNSLSIEESLDSSSPDNHPTLTNSSTNGQTFNKRCWTNLCQLIRTSSPQNPDYIDRSKQGPSIRDMPFRGLRNLGNTCYMNCILQCLCHTRHLREFYVSGEYQQYLIKRGDLSYAFKVVMEGLGSTSCNGHIAPYQLKREVSIVTPMFSGCGQHDAREFLRFLLDELHEEINRASVEGRKSPADNETLREACARHLTWEDSRISELFGGMLRSEVCCSVCSNKSIVYIPSMDISLPIPRRQDGTAVSLSDCLDMIRRKETLDEEARPYCNKCMDLTRSTKQLFICKLPRYLVIQLKRFSYYPTRTKRTTPVLFNHTWEVKDSSDKTHTYSLYGIACHSGGLYGGHYIAYCQQNGVWRCFNDSRTSRVSWEHVRNREAYLLFYTEQ